MGVTKQPISSGAPRSTGRWKAVERRIAALPIRLIGLVALALPLVASLASLSGPTMFLRPGVEAFTQQSRLTASDREGNDIFGRSVSISGDTAIVGAPGDDLTKGAAYVYTRIGTVWTQQQKLTASDGVGNDSFGVSVAIMGNTAIVGAMQDDSNRGSAYVFTRSGSVWTQQQKIAASDGAGGDRLGASVALGVDTAVVGAWGDDSARGSAYVFTRSGSVWTQQQKLTAADGAASDLFGISVGISGETAVVGAYFDDSVRGSAYIYTRSGTTWTQQQKLTPADGVAQDQFGFSVAIIGNSVIIGAREDDSAKGSAYIFTRSGSVWTQEQKLTASNGAANDRFGSSVALELNSAIVTSPGDQGGRGAAYAFTRSGTVWTEQQIFVADYPSIGFGESVSFSGSSVIAGSSGDDVFRGAAYVFVDGGATPTPTGTPSASPTNSPTATPTGSPGGCLNNSTVANANDSGEGSLRQAVADTCPGGTITFFGVFTISLQSQIVIDKSLTIIGANTNIYDVLDGNNATRLINITNPDAIVSMRGMLFRNGRSNGGGAIRSVGSLTLNDVIFENNSTESANIGAGIYMAGGHLSLYGRMLGNTGGAIYLCGSTCSMTNISSGVIRISTIYNNSSGGNGGAINIGPMADLKIINSTISGNTAAGSGGAVINNGTLTTINSTFSNNTAGTSGGAILNPGTATLHNTIVAGNNATTSPDVSGDYINSANNLIGKRNGSTGLLYGTNGNISGTIAAPVDPLIGPLANNGCQGCITFTHNLLAGSPAIDNGNNALAVNETGVPLTIDQRGRARIVNGTVDIGALEVQSTPSPTPTSTPTATPTATPVGAGFEGDIAPRPNGDGVVLTTDVTQMRRFATGLDPLNPAANEGQRADCAPRASFGDGAITSADVVQARRYATGLDPLTAAAGPSVSTIPSESMSSLLTVFTGSFSGSVCGLTAGWPERLLRGRARAVPGASFSKRSALSFHIEDEYAFIQIAGIPPAC